MTHHENLLRAGMAPHDLTQRVPRPRRDVVEPFTAGYANLRGFAAPAQEKIGILFFDFVERQSFKFAMIEFANIFSMNTGKLCGRLIRVAV